MSDSSGCDVKSVASTAWVGEGVRDGEMCRVGKGVEIDSFKGAFGRQDASKRMRSVEMIRSRFTLGLSGNYTGHGVLQA